MNNWKDLGEYGRGGDTEIREVDGNPAHVNLYEAYLIDAYDGYGEEEVKRIGSGTTNPSTGLKEYSLIPMDASGQAISKLGMGGGGAGSSLLGPVGMALQVGSMLYGGFQALENKKKVKKAKAGLKSHFNQQVQDLTAAKNREFEAIDTQYGVQTQQVDVKTTEALENLTQAASGVQIGQGFEVSEEATVDTTKMMAAHRTEAENIAASRAAQQQSALLTRTEGISQEADRMAQAEASLEDIETSFIGGMFG